MDVAVELVKNETIKTKGKATRERHSKMRPLTVELKLSLNCLNKKERSKLFSYFTQCRWLRNYLLSLSDEEFKSFDTKVRDITSLDKDGSVIKRHLDLPAKIIQDVKSCLVNDIKVLAGGRSKTGKVNGKLKFRSKYRTLPWEPLRTN